MRGSVRDEARHEDTRTRTLMLRWVNTVGQGKARSAPPVATEHSIGNGNQEKSTDTLLVNAPAWEVRATDIARMTAAATQKRGHRNCIHPQPQTTAHLYLFPNEREMPGTN